MKHKRLFLMVLITMVASVSAFAMTVEGLTIPKDISDVLIKGVKIIQFALGFLAFVIVGKLAFAVFKAQPQERGRVLMENLLNLVIVAVCFLGIWGIPQILGMGNGTKDEAAVVRVFDDGEYAKLEINESLVLKGDGQR